jgi:nicotinamide mononucleotide adenylyltransferase
VRSFSVGNFTSTNWLLGLWAQEDLDRILGHYGAFILERSGTDIGKLINPTADTYCSNTCLVIDDALLSLQQWRDNIRVIPQLIQNDVSSTKIRLFRKRGKSIRYYIPDKVVDYIYEHDLYLEDDKKQSEKGKERGSGDSTPSTLSTPSTPSAA